jgi:iron(III) transport system permease protein
MPPRPRGTVYLDRWLLGICVLALGLTVLYPTARLIVTAFQIGSSAIVFQGAGPRVIVNTLIISLVSVISAGLLGTTLALLLTRYRFPGRNVLAAVAYLPYALPPLVGTLSFWYIIGPDGYLPRTIEHWFGVEDAYPSGPMGIIIIHTYSFYVLYYAMVSTALESMDPSLVEAARSHGAGRIYAFRRVTLPLLRPAIFGASLLTFMSSGASFSAPLFFGGDFAVLSTQIYNERTQSRYSEEVTFTVALATIALLGIFIFRVEEAARGGSKGLRSANLAGPGRYAAAALAAASILVLLTPHAVILVMSFVDHRAWHTELIPPAYTLENYRSLFTDSAMFRPIVNSLWMGGVAALAVIFVGLPCAYLIGRRKTGGWLMNVLVMVPWALPGTVVAINLLVATSDPWFPLVLLSTTLPVAYFVRTVPMFTRMATAAIQVFDTGLIEAARSLGATPRYAFWHVTLPLLAPAVISAAAMVFVTCLGEFVASVLLYSNWNMPIAVKINEQWQRISVGAAFAYSVLLMVLVAATFVLSRRFSSRMI